MSNAMKLNAVSFIIHEENVTSEKRKLLCWFLTNLLHGWGQM